MDYIKEALIKAKAAADLTKPQMPATAPPHDAPSATPHQDAPAVVAQTEVADRRAAATVPWAPPRVSLDPRHLDRHRVVSRALSDPSHLAFNMLRTRTLKIMRESARKSIALTSPTPGCGKTMVSVNLAFSLARSPNCRTVLVDLDLRRPSVARVLGIEAKGSVGEYLSGKCRAEDCFVEASQDLVVGLGKGSLRNSSELIHGDGIAVLLKFISEKLAPDMILFDMPPMQVGDDTIAFLPMADAALLVIAAGTTGAGQVIDCERQIDNDEKLIGIVLNKCEVPARDYYDYY